MRWFEQCYSRLLVDNHITDLDPSLMSRFDPETYARMAELGGAESSMVYSCDHNGNCYFPTRIGHMHAGLKGRDIFGETVAALKRRGITPIAYYTVVYHNHSVERYPDSEQVDICGKRRPGRYRVSCLNCEETLEYYQHELEQVVEYPVEGIFIDMTFWLLFCCCDRCRAKFRERYGREIPETIDWRDENWRNYVKFREECVAEYAARLTAAVRAKRPDISVVHQFSGMFAMLIRGQSGRMVASSDYASGDFYGDREQQRFGVKMFDAYTAAMPYEYMTSRCVNLYDHTSTKCDDELLSHALTTLANGGAYFFIDAINPDGTMEERFYRRLGAINRRLKPFRDAVRAHRPRLIGEVGIYFSPAAFADTALNGVPLRSYGDAEIMSPAIGESLREAVGAGELLTRLHVPWRVVCENTADLSPYKVVILAGATNLTEEECAKLRRFVADGGTLLATSRASLVDKDFALADVLGVHYTGEDAPTVCYVNLGEDGYVSANRRAPYASPEADTAVHATLTIPLFPPFDPDRYAAIHSNPPGRDTAHPAWTEHAYGKGRAVWLAVNAFGIPQDSQREFCIRLLQAYLPPSPVLNGRELPAALEVTFMRGADGALLVGAVNCQKEYPLIPLADVELRLRLPGGFRPARVTRASDGAAVDAASGPDGTLVLKADRLLYGEIWILEEK